MEKNPPAYLSASRLTTYLYCPAEFFKRYILQRDEPPTPERSFGTAVHKGLEAMMLGEDEDLAFLRSWRELKLELDAADQIFGKGLPERGLELLSMVRDLNLSGIPERRIDVIWPDIPLPFIGYTDLWSEGHIVDFKTSGYGWTQDKADAQIFQPAIYSQAHADEYGYLPKFSFVVLPRIQGPVQILDGTRSGQQITDAFDQAKKILEQIEAGKFNCTCTRHLEAA